MYENIVLSGGSIKGYAYLGILKCLEEYDIVKNIKPISKPLTQRYLSSSHNTSQFTVFKPNNVSVGKNSMLNLFLKTKGFTLLIINILRFLSELFVYYMYTYLADTRQIYHYI